MRYCSFVAVAACLLTSSNAVDIVCTLVNSEHVDYLGELISVLVAPAMDELVGALSSEPELLVTASFPESNPFGRVLFFSNSLCSPHGPD
jgi:hypothetical protein